MKKHFIVVSVLSVVLSGCSMVSNLTQKTEEQVIEQTVKSNCKYEKDVCDFLAVQAKSFQKEVVMTSVFGDTTSETRLDGKGNIHSITKQNGKEVAQMIIFNNATYMKDASERTWFKMSNESNSDTSAFNSKKMIEEMQETYSEENTKLVVKNLGEEACENLTCKKYEMYDEDLADTKTIVWVDTSEKLARKMEISGEKTSTTVTYTYDQKVTITEPSPVKEFSMPQVPQNGQAPSQEEIQKMIQEAQQGSEE